MSQMDLLAAIEAGEAGMAQVTAASDDQDVRVVDQAILAVAARGLPFSSHDVRPLLPELRSLNLIGSRFNTLARREGWKYLRHETCRTPSSHGRKVAVWQKVD